MRALEPEPVEQIEIVEGQIRDVLDPLGGGRAAVAGMAREVHAEVRGEALLEREPAPGAAGAVQEHERRPRAVLEHLDGGAANGELVRGRHPQPMKRPPFGESHCPVKNELSSEARKSAVAATSCASPVRRSGVRAITVARISGDIRSVIGVSM